MRAVQLIAFDANKNPFIPPTAIEALRGMSSRALHVVAVAGKYRTGKSYILNRVLLGRKDGFSVGHTINACTKGLWMWPELVKLQGKDCLIVDTEGLGSLEQGESTDLKIFLLALLFSSQLIYNSVGSIDEQAIDSLSLVVQLAGVLHRQDRYDSQELINTFPAFLWLLRDFSLKLEDDRGAPISPTNYLEMALRHQARSSPAADRKNQIRKQLRTFFADRDCYALVRPTEQERDLQNLSTVDDCKLRPEFVGLVQGLRVKLGEKVRPKRVRGRVLDTEGFIELCQYYTRALVDGRLPSISSHWDQLCLSQTHRIFQKYQLEHIKALEAHQEDSARMEEAHMAILQEGLQAIDRSFLGKLEKQLLKERFQRKLQEQLKEAKGRASRERNKHLRTLLQAQEGSGGEPVERLQAAIVRMAQLSETATRDDHQYCEFYLYLCELSRSLLQEATSARHQQEQAFSNKVCLMEEQIGQLRRQLEEERISHEEAMGDAERRLMAVQAGRRSNVQGGEKALAELLQLQSQTASLTRLMQTIQQTLSHKQSENKRLQQTNIQLQEEMTVLTQRIVALEREVCERDGLIQLETIKSRKANREKDIIRQRYQENLEEGLRMRETISVLQRQVAQLQAQGYSETPLSPLAHQLLQAKQENRLLSRLLHDQKITLEAVMQLPHNVALEALRKNLEVEQKQRERLARVLQGRERQLDVSYYCSQIGEMVFWVEGTGGKVELGWSGLRRLVEGGEGDEDWERRRQQLQQMLNPTN